MNVLTQETLRASSHNHSGLASKQVLLRFGEAIRVVGEKNSTAGEHFVRQAKQNGETACFLTPPFVNPGDTVILTGEEAKAYNDLTEKAKKGAIIKLLRTLPGEGLSSFYGLIKRQPTGEGVIERTMRKVSEDFVEKARPQVTALMANPRTIQAEEILASAAEHPVELVQKIMQTDFDSQVLASKIPVLVDFSAPWCGPCKQIEPLVHALAEKYQGQLKVVTVNVDENTELAGRLKIQGVPTLQVYKYGALVAAHTGALGKAKLEKLITPYLDL